MQLERTRLCANYAPNYLDKYLNPDFVIGCIEKRGNKNAHYQMDHMFYEMMSDIGWDCDELLKMYSLTPIVPESVYKDFGKYHVFPDTSNVDWQRLEIGAQWLLRHKRKVLGKQRPQILNYDAVKQLIDLSKSATALFNTTYKNKRELLEDKEFLASYVRFLNGYAKGEPFYILWLAIQKEEIRPTEKIDEMKIRSIIVGSIYSLLLGHSLYADMDDMMAERWYEYRSGIGMSFFNGQYNKKFVPYEDKPCLGYSDVGKYDSRQAFYLQQLAAWVADGVYEVTHVSFYELLGSLAPMAKEMGLPDFDVNVPYLRSRLIEDGVFGPVIMPDGVLVSTNTGEKSGNHRTGHSNTDRYKIVEFAAASCFYKDYDTYISEAEQSETGDDMIHGSSSYDVMDKQNEIWKSLGCDVDVHKVANVNQLEYLGSNPVLVRWEGLEYWMPKVNSAKVLAGLVTKLGDRNLDVDIARLSSAKVLCHFTEDKPLLDKLVENFKKKFPSCRNDTRWWSDAQINSFYFGSLESKTVEQLMDFQLFNDNLSLGGFHVFSCPELPRVSYQGKNAHRPVKREISFPLKVHGKYCGPGWSDGKYQNSVQNGKSKPVDSVDSSCRDHDTAYATPGSDLLKADLKLAKEALTSANPVGKLISSGIGAQALLRSAGILDRYNKQVVSDKEARTKLNQMVKTVNINESKQKRGRSRSRRGKSRSRSRAPMRHAKAKPSRGRRPSVSRNIPAFYNTGPRRNRTTIKSAKTNTMRVSGQVQFGNVAVTTANVPGSVIFQKFITPSNIDGTRLQTFATMFERWKVHKLWFEWCPIVGTNATGNIIMAVDPDPTDQLVEGTAQINRALDQGGKEFPLIDKGVTVATKPEKGFTDLFTSDSAEIRWSALGIMYVVCNFVPSSPLAIGNIVMHYDLTFYKATLEGGSSPLSNTTMGTGTTAVSANNTFGDVVTTTGGSSGVVNGGGQRIFFSVQPSSLYYICLGWKGTGVTGNVIINYNDANGITTGSEINSTSRTIQAFTGTQVAYMALVKVNPGFSKLAVAATASTPAGLANGATFTCMCSKVNVLSDPKITQIELKMNKTIEEKLKALEDKLEQKLLALEYEDSDTSSDDSEELEEMIRKKLEKQARRQSKYTTGNVAKVVEQP